MNEEIDAKIKQKQAELDGLMRYNNQNLRKERDQLRLAQYLDRSKDRGLIK